MTWVKNLINMAIKKNRINFFGAKIDPLTMPETLDAVAVIIERREPTQHVVVNVAKLVMMQKDQGLSDIVNACGLINADGQGIVWGAKLLGIGIPERVAGIDLFQNIVRMAAERNYKLYFLGAKEEVVKRTVDRFNSQYPRLQVAGFHNGYFNDTEEAKIVEDIRDSRADVLFVAMSSPWKEIFISKYMEQMAVPFVMGVGGSFDVVAGGTKRAPEWMQKMGLEWFYRFLCEPKRMWKRYLVTNTVYLGMILKALVTGKREVA